MDHAGQLRDRAARVFALAMKARERGDQAFSDELTSIANEALAEADRFEHETFGTTPLPADGDAQSIVQQQQQAQQRKPEIDDKKDQVPHGTLFSRARTQS
jgi:hypothetical protein